MAQALAGGASGTSGAAHARPPAAGLQQHAASGTPAVAHPRHGPHQHLGARAPVPGAPGAYGANAEAQRSGSITHDQLQRQSAAAAQAHGGDTGEGEDSMTRWMRVFQQRMAQRPGSPSSFSPPAGAQTAGTNYAASSQQLPAHAQQPAGPLSPSPPPSAHGAGAGGGQHEQQQ